MSYLEDEIPEPETEEPTTVAEALAIADRHIAEANAQPAE
jgi:hypothetical protein